MLFTDHSYAASYEETYALSKRIAYLEALLKEKDRIIENLHKTVSTSESKIQNLSLECRSLTSQLKAACEKVRELTSKVRNTQSELTYDALQSDTEKLKYYTGFASPGLLQVFYDFLKPDLHHLQFWQMKAVKAVERRKFYVPLKDQLILVLVRLRLGLDGMDLAFRFGISNSTLSRIWITWLDFLRNRLTQIPTWPSSDVCDRYRPEAFKEKGYDTVDGILDCTEIFIETPSSFRVQSETYSTYKKHNTLKGLVVCAPNGFVTFVSNLAPGRLSDKDLTLECGVLDKFEKGRALLADRGFLIQDACDARGIHLNIPPFMNGKPQLSSEDERETRRIASVRIHIERVIRRIKIYRILTQVLPNSMSTDMNSIWLVCALLSNWIDKPLLDEPDTPPSSASE